MNFFAIVHGENSESCSRMSKFVTLFSKLIWWISLEQNFFVQEKFSFCEWRKLFCDETHRKTQHFCSFFSKKNVIFLPKFSREASLPEPPICWYVHFHPASIIFQTEGSFQTAENEGSFFMSKPSNGPNREMFISVRPPVLKRRLTQTILKKRSTHLKKSAI